uniref:Spondin-1 n=1 Tax=Anopheles dirus TaxID=7168 RepID=A0A182N3K1_9DIPT
MSAGSGGLGGTAAAAALLKSPQTALQLLLEEINFQRTKEMRQLLKDDGGFVVLQGTTYWTDLFVRHFLFQSEPEHSIDCDDLLFFVRKKHIKGSSRAMPRYETEIEVFRKDSRKLPIGDPDVDWEETVYLNLVIHQFNYTLTLAICTRTSPKELQVLRRHSQKVYASPSRRKMDTKGDSEEITYPHICFMVDNFDEVFHDILVRDGEMVCVELVATDRDGSVQGVIFLGSIRYDALKKVYDARQSSLGSKVAQRMSFGLFSSGGPQTRCEFVRMKGPQGKGHAEMAVTKPKGSGVETPTSEPGFCATDMWDSEWEEDCEEYYNYRHQRRLSDPSANLNNFSRYGWRTKNAGDPGASYGGSKARSENEGLDCLANEVSEIEAGDLRDDRPASSSASVLDTVQSGTGSSKVGKADSTPAVDMKGDLLAGPPATTKTPKTGCCSCFGGTRKRWSDVDSVQMSEVYTPCPTCGTNDERDEPAPSEPERRRLESLELSDSPACLATVSKGRSPLMKHRNVLIVESELEFAGGAKVRTGSSGPNGSSPTPDKGSGKKKSSSSVADTLGAVKRREHGSKAAQSPKKRLSTPVFRSKRGSNGGSETTDATGHKPNAKAKASNAINNNAGVNRRSAPPSTTSAATEATEASEEYEIADDAVSLNGGGGDLTDGGGEAAGSTAAAAAVLIDDPKQRIRVNGREEFPAERNNGTSNGNHHQPSKQPATTMVMPNIKEHRDRRTANGARPASNVATNGSSNRFSLIYRRSKSSSAAGATPVAPSVATSKKDDKKSKPQHSDARKKSDSAGKQVVPDQPRTPPGDKDLPPAEKNPSPDRTVEEAPVERDINGNPDETTGTTREEGQGQEGETTEESELSNRAIWAALKELRARKECSTLPKVKKLSYNSFYSRPTILANGRDGIAVTGGTGGAAGTLAPVIDTIPSRRTPDGTNIYYLCDYHPRRHHQQTEKELDDGAYNPLWTTKGFTQTFHFWKENRRQQSTPLNAFLTYVTLPWWSIAKETMDPPRRVLRIAVLLLPLLLAGVSGGCSKAPSVDGRPVSTPKQPGDNGYRLAIRDDPKGYEPGKIYNLFIVGSRTHAKLQQFSHFTLMAHARNGARTYIAGPRRVGRFQLFSDALTKFHDQCVNTVTQADDFPKSEIQVMWVAPATGSGCVSISAMVYEDEQQWYADDGALTKVLCEQEPTVPRLQKGECCACDEAKYSLTFEGIWSNETHPKDYPFAIWLTHFSDVIGASHDTNFSFWGEQHIATDGFRMLAEWGSVRLLEDELRAKGSRLRTLIKAAGLWYPRVNANTTSNFRVDRKHHKISLASMFGPSPDWVVGVSGLDLCRADCTWTEALDIDLYPWDAGTDGGISYMSANAETQPRERMHRITTLYPEDPRAPFYNPHSTTMVPLARLYVRRERVMARGCDEQFLQAQVLELAENTEEETRPECATTEYTDWTPCSVTCGKGIRMRTREYLQPDGAATARCNRQLIAKEMCVAPVPECEVVDGADAASAEDVGQSAASVDEAGEGVGVCRTTRWSEWSECSASCGIGVTMRTRTFVENMGRKKCPHISVVEKQKCMQPECSITDMEAPDPLCPVTAWSDWSPCSATCGKGVQIRTRLLLLAPEEQDRCQNRIELNQQRPCTDKADCLYDTFTAQEICSQPPEVGPCRGRYQRYAYSLKQGTCVPFYYGGCRGNRNNFLTADDCMHTCTRWSERAEDVATGRPTTVDPFEALPVDCVLSDWSEWTACSVTCGTGRSERVRSIVTQPRNGGQPCPPRVVKRRKCTGPPCH